VAAQDSQNLYKPYLHGGLMIIPCIAQAAPVPATATSAGVDLRANIPNPLRILPGAVRRIPTGLQVELPPGTVGMVCPRSGLALNHQLTVINAPGLIDPDYRGEVGVVLINHGTTPYVVEPDERVAQLIVLKAEALEFVVVPVLSQTNRGAGGFGSTGST